MIRVVAVLSSDYSGSTLLTRLLATHPEVATIGERDKLGRKMLVAEPQGARDCSCGRPFVSCPEWQAATGAAVEAVGGPPDRDLSRMRPFSGDRFERALRGRGGGALYRAARPAPLVGPRLRAIEDFNAALMGEVLRRHDASVFAEDSKEARSLVLMARSPRFDVRVVHLVRDGRAQVASNRRHLRERGKPHDAATVATAWRDGIAAQRAAVAHLGVPVVPIRYEDLCADPRAELARLGRALGLDPTAFGLDLDARKVHTLGNRSSRGWTDATTIELRTEWPAELTPDDLATFTRIAGPTNTALGYDP